MKSLNLENGQYMLILDEFDISPLDTLITVRDEEGSATISLSADELVQVRNWINSRLEDLAMKR